MNIVVKTASGRCIVRPDTTWERDCEDFFPPEFVDRITYAPVIFARICKPGRSIGERFAGRYYDGIGYGVLLYPQDLIDGSEAGFACASCLDHTSFLPFPVSEKDKLGSRFILRVGKNGKASRTVFIHDGATEQMIVEAIAEVTKYVYIRIGDIVAIELKPRSRMCSRTDGTVELSGSFDGTNTLNFKIKY